MHNRRRRFLTIEHFSTDVWVIWYLDLLIDQYRLRTKPEKKPVIGLDDLYLLL